MPNESIAERENYIPRTPEERERRAQRGIVSTSHIVAAHLAGQSRAEEFFASLSTTFQNGDELFSIAGKVAAVDTVEGRAHARGFFGRLQKIIYRVGVCT